MATREEDRFIAHEALSAREWRAVQELSKAFADFEPLAMRDRIGPLTAKSLLEKGLAEMGPSEPRFDRATFPIGYRLTSLGWKIMRRGRKP